MPCAGIVAAVGFDKNEWAELLKELTGGWLRTPAVQGARATRKLPVHTCQEDSCTVSSP